MLLLEGPLFCPLYYAAVCVISFSCQMVCFQFLFPLYFSLESLHPISTGTPYSDIPLIVALILLSEGPLFCPLYYTAIYVISFSYQMVHSFVSSIILLFV